MKNKSGHEFRKGFWRLARITKTEKLFELLYHFTDALAHKKKVFWLTVDTVEHYCKDNNEILIENEAGCGRLIYEPPFFEKSDEKEYQCTSPSIYVAYVHDAVVLPETGIILVKKDILCDFIKRDSEHRIKWPWGSVRMVEGSKALLVVGRNMMEIEQAINLCGFASNNYYHFTMEILSRLEYVNRLQDTEGIPVLIDEGITNYPQLVELLQIVVQKRKIIYVPNDTCVRIQLLIQPSMNTWGILNVRSWDCFRMSDNLIAQSGILNIRSWASKYMQKQSMKKFFISRKNYSTSRLMNEPFIIPLFEAAGFDIVYPETMSYVEQIRLFSSAKCVVGVTGAAMTNIVYCQPGTVVGCFIPQEYGFYIYSTMARLVGCQMLFLSPEIISKSECIVADSLKVDEEQCGRYIEKLNEMCR